MRNSAVLFLALTACAAPSEADLQGTRGSKLDVFFNDPGTRPENMWHSDFPKVLVEMIDNANATIDMAVMGFSYPPLEAALERAYKRGVKIRMVGDAGHFSNSGYRTMFRLHIPLVAGNLGHIMHDKFMILDGRFVFADTANWEDSDFNRNVNNAFVIDSPPVAADFTAEFEQMFSGAFAAQKVAIDNGRTYQIGDTEVEVWFSPNEDAMGRILQLVSAAQTEIDFTIFAFTKDQLGSALVERAEAGVSVSGVIDQSQLHSNGQYTEGYRLLAAGIPVRLDGDDNSALPGDYQRGGGRLHSKTMVIDPDSDDPVVISGSFNWSSSASQSNDEYLLVFHGGRIAKMYRDYYEYLWDQGRPLGIDTVAAGDVQPGDVVVNEVQWYGLNDGDPDGNDEFIELRNLTDHDLRLDMWQISNELDVVIGLPPGSRIPANGTFLILDHTLEAYSDGAPQDQLSAYNGGDLVLNAFNDNRQSRLYLKDGSLELYLRDPQGVEIDRVGDGGAAFAGGPAPGGVVRSMERNEVPGDGANPSSWHSCSAEQGGVHVNPDYKSLMRSTPGEPNTP